MAKVKIVKEIGGSSAMQKLLINGVDISDKITGYKIDSQAKDLETINVQIVMDGLEVVNVKSLTDYEYIRGEIVAIADEDPVEDSEFLQFGDIEVFDEDEDNGTDSIWGVAKKLISK